MKSFVCLFDEREIPFGELERVGRRTILIKQSEWPREP